MGSDLEGLQRSQARRRRGADPRRARARAPVVPGPRDDRAELDAKLKRLRLDRWQPKTTHERYTLVGDRLLVIVIRRIPDEHGPYSVAALEFLDIVGATEEHAHELVGESRSLARAKAIAERYIAKWTRKRRRTEACDCGPIQKAG